MEQDIRDNGSVVREKYWIKTGSEVAHRDYPNRKMYVDLVVKQSKQIFDGVEKRQHTFVLGVDCHWMTENGEFGKGRFLTMELIPYKNG